MPPTPFAPLELLAPARDCAVGMAAIGHGADAVYIGGPGFGARADAGNSFSDIEKLAAYAHRYRARIYLTLNTILFDGELEQANAIAWSAHEAGVDGLIIQDMGLLKTDLPPLEIHASTQCDIRTPEKAAFLDAVGFSQVVLARELTLEEIAACRAAMPRARIEFFVHGALCVSYSGRCYLSCAESGRSANRGQCAQPCRLPYQVIDFAGREVAHRKHVLSLRDNDQSGNLEDLVRAGVSSFKIEGRLKDAAYVKNITAYYRRKIDALLEKHAAEGWQASSLGATAFSFTPDPQKTFHRGSTDYFVRGRQPMIAELDTPKSTGKPVGQVLCLNTRPPQSLDVRICEPIANGDGLIYTDSHGEVVGLMINRAEELPGSRQRLYPRDSLSRHPDLAPGARLNRTRDRAFDKALEGESARRTIPVDFVLSSDRQSVSLSAHAAGETALVKEPFCAQAAKDPVKGLESLRGNLAKTGETIFAARAITVEPAGTVPFIPASIANRMRRAALTELEKRICRKPAPRLLAPIAATAPFDSLDWHGNVANAAARSFWSEHGVKSIEAAFESNPKGVSLATAELMRCRHCVRHTLGLCPKMVKGDPQAKERFKKLNGGHLKPEPMKLIDPKGRTLIARFDCRACEMTISLA